MNKDDVIKQLRAMGYIVLESEEFIRIMLIASSGRRFGHMVTVEELEQMNYPLECIVSVFINMIMKEL